MNASVVRGILGLAAPVFVVLKLTDVIAWSWWWVTVPLWGGIALVMALIGLAVVVIQVRDSVRVVASAFATVGRWFGG